MPNMQNSYAKHLFSHPEKRRRAVKPTLFLMYRKSIETRNNLNVNDG